jgi:outer membrane protein assembly factor BamB
MHRIAASNGEVLSTLALDPHLKPMSAPLITRDAVMVLLADEGADYRALIAIEPSLGRIRWRRAAPDRWSTTRIFATEKAVILGTPAGEVTAYCAADGSPAWSHELDGYIRTIGGSDEALYVGTREGTLYAVRPPHSCHAK